jgi:hypothetical protein
MEPNQTRRSCASLLGSLLGLFWTGFFRWTQACSVCPCKRALLGISQPVGTRHGALGHGQERLDAFIAPCRADLASWRLHLHGKGTLLQGHARRKDSDDQGLRSGVQSSLAEGIIRFVIVQACDDGAWCFVRVLVCVLRPLDAVPGPLVLWCLRDGCKLSCRAAAKIGIR